MANTDVRCVEDLESVIDCANRHYIYEYNMILPNGETVGKVGYTIAPKQREREWSEIYNDWQGKIRFSYLGTSDIDNNTFFMDHAVHTYGKKNEGWQQVKKDEFPENVHYTKEAYHGATAQNTAIAVKTLRDEIRNGKTTAKLYKIEKESTKKDVPCVPYVPRENQAVCIKNILKAYKNGRKHLLCAAHPRFGKSFTTIYALDKIGTINFVMVVSAVADAAGEWEDTINLPNFRDTWVYLDSHALETGTGHEIRDAVKSGHKICLFCTLQDIEGDDIKEKHAEIYDFAGKDSFLVVDETHNGGRGETFSKKIKRLDMLDDDTDEILLNATVVQRTASFGFEYQLYLSGTPYRILMTDEFEPEDIVYLASYSDLLREKHAWFTNNPNKAEYENPYYEFPERYNFVYNLSQIPDENLKQHITENGIPNLSEILETDPVTGKFVDEGIVRSIVHAMFGGFENDGCWGVLVDKTLENAVNKFHILMKLPSIAACDALANLLSEDDCGDFAGYAVIRATSNEVTNPSVRDIQEQIENANKSASTAGTLTLTCQRLSAAVSVKQWNTIINASDGKSAQDYDQFAMRACTPYAIDATTETGENIKQVLKPNIFVIDLVPERVLSVAIQAAMAKCTAENASSPEVFRGVLERDVSSASTFLVSGLEHMKQVTAVDIMDLSANYENTTSIDSAVNRVPFCPSLFDGSLDRIMRTFNGEISGGKSIDTKVYEDADDIDVSNKNTKNVQESLSSEKKLDNNNISKLHAEQTAKQKAFLARIGYLAVLADSHHDSLDALLDECTSSPIAEQRLWNVTDMTLDDCRKVASVLMMSPRVRISVDRLVYNMTRRMNDTNLTNEEKLEIFEKSFTKLGTAEIITPKNIVKEMLSTVSDETIHETVSLGARIVELSSETGEFAVGLVKRFSELGYSIGDARACICSVPASPLAYECTKKVYELLGLDPDNIYGFTVYDLLDKIIEENDNNSDDDFVYGQITDILKQVKKPQEIMLDDIVKETGKVDIVAIVGNPPYQNTLVNTSDAPIYNFFIDMSHYVSNESVLITPARFLFNAGKTSKEWNKKILSDKHFKIISYFPNSKEIFTCADIKGGLAISKYSKNETFQPVGIFIPYNELRDVLKKVKNSYGFSSIENIIDKNIKLDLNVLYNDFPDLKSNIGSNGKERRIISNAFEKLHVFTTLEGKNKVAILGRENNERVYKWIDKKYIVPNNSFNSYKVILPASNGSGALGERLSTPMISTPMIGYTQTFISIGNFSTLEEAEACLKYIKTKFARVLLGILKVTQSNKSAVWHFVPQQNFTSSSDIDWSKTIPEIDQQLYKKYGLSQKEIDYIETHIQEMS